MLGSIARHRRAEHRVEFGYWLAPEARGRGIATRALRLIAGWSLAGGYIRLELFTHPDNIPSGRVAERAGFTREGLRRAWDLDRDGNPVDGVFYALVRGGGPRLNLGRCPLLGSAQSGAFGAADRGPPGRHHERIVTAGRSCSGPGDR